jgi:hypothetical protein
MKRSEFMQPHQLARFAHFLDEHPGFSPLLVGEDALVCGFQIGGSYVGIEEMERMIAARPSFNGPKAALMLVAAAGKAWPERC